MKIHATMTLLILLAATLALAAMGEMKKADGERKDQLYWCACGDGCTCGSVATKPGNCTCGKPMAGGHLLKMDGTVATVCQCGPDCKCSLSKDDPTKCGCGSTVKKVELKDTEVFTCNCNGSCECNTVSDKEGDCGCGMPLRKMR